MPEPFEKRIAHHCFPQPVADAQFVWRYMGTAKFISLLSTASLHLARLDTLGDPHEGATPKVLREARNQSLVAHGVPEGPEQMAQVAQRIRRSTFVSCWNLSSEESEALWRIYSGANEGVAIRARYSSLVNLIRPHDDLYVGRVSYLDYETEWFPADNLLYPVMHKRRAFSHEAEVRLVRLTWQLLNKQAESPASSNLAVDLLSLVDAIYINPYAAEWYADAIRASVAKFTPALESRVTWSRMKAEPLY